VSRMSANARTGSSGRSASEAWKRSEGVATDEVREASRARAPDSPSSSEGRDARKARPTKNALFSGGHGAVLYEVVRRRSRNFGAGGKD
jgi:hypothetical protein